MPGSKNLAGFKSRIPRASRLGKWLCNVVFSIDLCLLEENIDPCSKAEELQHRRILAVGKICMIPVYRVVGPLRGGSR